MDGLDLVLPIELAFQDLSQSLVVLDSPIHLTLIYRDDIGMSF